MLDAIISGIGKIKKVNDLKNLQARGDLSFDEFSTMKYLLMYGRGDSVEFECFSRNKSNLESSLNDYGEVKQMQKTFLPKDTLVMLVELDLAKKSQGLQKY